MVGVTLLHSSVGLALGVTAGLIGAVALTVSRALRAVFLPLALLLQTVPLIAMAPVIYAVFGSGVLTAAVIAAVVTFFPLLMNIGAGLSSSSSETIDLVHAYGGGRWKLLWFVQLPSAVPALFAGLKLAAPATISAATLYEFLFSFEGLGANLLTSKSYSDYGLLWTLVVVTVLLALAAYALVVVAETVFVRGRFPRTTTAPKGLA
jgi:ABC-type nitrate/sulfonate/bicarbonate transport system permease component